jgi:hypothetical protein
MMDWKAAPGADPVPWLLEEENPSVRYFTLIDILGLDPQDKQALSCKKEIMKKGVVPKILSRQKKEGYWEKKEDFYVRTKYRGTVWQLIILAELGADGDDERIKKACEFVLRISQDRRSGGFSYLGKEESGGYHSCVLPCLTGNMVWSLSRLGYLEDRRVQQGIDWVTAYQRFDDGVLESPVGWPYEKRENCWGRHTCHMGVVKTLRALAEKPEEKRSGEVKTTIGRAAEYLLRHHIFKRSHDLTKIAKPKWVRLGFPTIWDSDVLEVLGLLVRLGFKDARMQEAVDLVLAKQDEQGRWRLENTYNGRLQVNIEQKSQPSKWITLNALRALRGFFSK